MADAYDAFLADLYGRPNQLTREEYFRIYGDQLGPAANPNAFLYGSINSGQYGNISSIAPDPFTGQVVTQRNPGPEYISDDFGARSYEPQPLEGAAAMPIYDPALGWYTPTTPLPPSQLTSASGSNIDLALGRSSGTGYSPTGPTGYNLASVNQVNSAAGAQSVANSLGMIGCNQIANPTVRMLCFAALNAVTGGNGMGVPMGGMSMQNGGGGMAFSGGCPPGAMQVMGKCVDPSAMMPGGIPFVSPATGIFGAPSVSPSSSSQRVLKCARGLVLGKDNRCYAKGSIPRNARKWAPEPRPLVSRSDVKALAKIKSIRGRVKKAASSAGLSCATKGARAAKAKRK